MADPEDDGGDNEDDGGDEFSPTSRDDEEASSSGSEGADTGRESSSRARTPRPKRAPRQSLTIARELADTLFAAVGSGSTETAAFQEILGHGTGRTSAFDNKLALLRTFGLVSKRDVQLTKLGLEIIRDDQPEVQMAARRAVVMNTPAFAKSLKDFDGKPLPTREALAVSYKYENEMMPAVAEQAATAFLESARYAGFVDEEGLVRLEGGQEPFEGAGVDTEPIDDRQEILDESPEDDDGSEPSEVDEAGSLERSGDTGRPDVPNTTARALKGGSTAEGGPQSVEFRLDLKGYSADEVVKILNTMGFSDASNKP